MKNLGKLSLAALLVSAACGASAAELYSSEQGSVSLSGSARGDIDYTSYDAGVSDAKGTDATGTGGRVEVILSGEREMDNGYFAGFKSAYETLSGVAAADQYVQFGMKESWDVTIGYFEGANMQPTGQDTMLSADRYNGNSARGRSDDGEVMVRGYVGGLTAELNVTAENDGVEVLGSGDVAGRGVAGTVSEASSSSNPVWVRPMLSYTGGNITVALSYETVVNLEDAPQGIAAKFAYADDAMTVNAGIASQSFEGTSSLGMQDTTMTSSTLNMTLASGLGMGIFYTEFDDDKKVSPEWDQTVYNVSYKISDVMGMDNFEMIPAAYYSSTQYDDEADKRKEMGMRLRVQYNF